MQNDKPGNSQSNQRKILTHITNGGGFAIFDQPPFQNESPQQCSIRDWRLFVPNIAVKIELILQAQRTTTETVHFLDNMSLDT